MYIKEITVSTFTSDLNRKQILRCDFIRKQYLYIRIIYANTIAAFDVMNALEVFKTSAHRKKLSKCLKPGVNLPFIFFALW